MSDGRKRNGMAARNGRRRFVLGAAAALGAGLGAGLGAPAAGRDRPQNAGRDVVGQSLDQIVERGWIEIGVYDAFPPWSYEQDGRAEGVDVEIGRLIARALDVEPRFRLVGADETVDDDLRNHVWKGDVIERKVVNVLMHVPYDREFALRNDLAVITGLYMTETLAIAWRRDAFAPDERPSPAYFRYAKVGVETDSIADLYLLGAARGALQQNVRHYPSTAAAMAAMAAGEVPAVMGPRGQLEAALTEGMAVHAPPLPGLARPSWPLGVAVRHTYRALGYAVNDAVRAAVEDGRVAAIFARRGLTYAPPVW
ncbi:substrate-binding periplasmic protein [Oceanicella actignis]|uniref:substrate-binding periplasmic protein n=1 Tax=Oceanicella actignis TaxID=1189325 RepID=UPI00125A6F1C|nr:transporter substrate-binding domain-containing protein [Oceanicella actignis]TYO89565.1 amino acid ABC transporter substrate-binding protein (PAAT family) [Oceanicella actignis]